MLILKKTYQKIFFLFLFIPISLSLFSKNCIQSSDDVNGGNDNQTDLREFYDATSEYYEELIAKTSYIGPTWIKSRIHFLKNGEKKLLDLGCANGILGEIVKKFRPDYSFDGIDYSKGMINACSKKNIYTHLICADLSNGLPKEFISKHFDVVFAVGCLEFISNHENLFKQIHDTLNPTGQLWLTVQASSTLNDSSFDIKTYSAEEIQHLLIGSGYKIMEFELCLAAYLTSRDQTAIPYYFIITERNY